MRQLASVVLFLLLVGISGVARAADDHPLRPIDTSSPRATLQGFIQLSDDVYRRMTDVLADYAASNRLYLSAEQRRKQLATFEEGREIVEYLDLSGIPPVLRDTVSIERAIQLKEILDRIDLPPMSDVPDQDAMAHSSLKRWRLPDTAIEIAQVQNGPRAGEYLVSADTVTHLPEYFARIRDLPYKPGAGKNLIDVYRAISHGTVGTIYDAFLSSPVGLSLIIPPRWILTMPTWTKVRIGDLAVWQWFGLCVVFVIGGLIIYVGQRLGRHRIETDDDVPRPPWRLLPLPLALVLVAGGLLPLFNLLLRIGGMPRVVIAYAETATLFLGGAWLVMVVSAVIGETIVVSERLKPRSLDGQLIRLGTRLIGLTAAIAILIYGGDQLGFPAYSVLAGLGVGGLAVALAARETIANLIGSLLITLEKPFRVGHLVRVGGTEGTVEDVGFRSTRIRTLDNVLVTIPSSSVVNSTIENLSLRPKRRQRFRVQVTYDTSPEKLQELVAGIKRTVLDNPLVEQSSCYITFYDLAESSLDILVIFHLLVDDYEIELREREAVLLRIMDLVRDLGLDFAFPTRTLTLSGVPAGAPAPAGGASVRLFG